MTLAAIASSDSAGAEPWLPKMPLRASCRLPTWLASEAVLEGAAGVLLSEPSLAAVLLAGHFSASLFLRLLPLPFMFPKSCCRGPFLALEAGLLDGETMGSREGDFSLNVWAARGRLRLLLPPSSRPSTHWRADEDVPLRRLPGALTTLSVSVHWLPRLGCEAEPRTSSFTSSPLLEQLLSDFCLLLEINEDAWSAVGVCLSSAAATLLALALFAQGGTCTRLPRPSCCSSCSTSSSSSSSFSSSSSSLPRKPRLGAGFLRQSRSAKVGIDLLLDLEGSLLEGCRDCSISCSCSCSCPQRKLPVGSGKAGASMDALGGVGAVSGGLGAASAWSEKGLLMCKLGGRGGPLTTLEDPDRGPTTIRWSAPCSKPAPICSGLGAWCPGKVEREDPAYSCSAAASSTSSSTCRSEHWAASIRSLHTASSLSTFLLSLRAPLLGWYMDCCDALLPSLRSPLRGWHIESCDNRLESEPLLPAGWRGMPWGCRNGREPLRAATSELDALRGNEGSKQSEWLVCVLQAFWDRL
mmetsp:Transcript_25814/g.69998  ORF Transcript_25814/g.69998 Transcript_25814/m.69998 type:complete len:524 (+) Transcript_25814:1335-2906(+)